MLHIQVEIKNVYGEERIYPVCEQAKLFSELAGTKTLTRQSIATIKKLGYTIIVNSAIVTL